MDRRDFLQAATLAAATGGTVLAADAPLPAQAQAVAVAAASPGEPQMRRFEEQRWVLDNIIHSVGLDWDQPRTLYWNAPSASTAPPISPAFASACRNMADITPAFEATARRRQAKAEAAEAEGDTVTARENYYMATIHWGAAQWPIDVNDEKNVFCNKMKRDCFGKYAKLADHQIEAVWIPFQGKALPGWLHLPLAIAAGAFPRSCRSPAWTASRKAASRSMATAGSIAASPSRDRGAGAIRMPGAGHLHERAGLGRGGEGVVRIRGGAARDRCAAHRRHRHQLRLLRRHDQRGAEPRYRPAPSPAPPRARLEHGLQQGLAHLQEALHVHVELHRRGEIRRVRQVAHLGGLCREDHMPYLCIAGESDELTPLPASELYQGHSGAQAVRRLSGFAPLGGRRAVGQSRPSAPTGLQADFMAAASPARPFRASAGSSTRRPHPQDRDLNRDSLRGNSAPSSVTRGLDPRVQGLPGQPTTVRFRVPPNLHLLPAMAGEGRPSTSFIRSTKVVDARDKHGHDAGEITAMNSEPDSRGSSPAMTGRSDRTRMDQPLAGAICRHLQDARRQ